MHSVVERLEEPHCDQFRRAERAARELAHIYIRSRQRGYGLAATVAGPERRMQQLLMQLNLLTTI